MQLKEDSKNCRSGEWGLDNGVVYPALPRRGQTFGGLGAGYLGPLEL